MSILTLGTKSRVLNSAADTKVVIKNTNVGGVDNSGQKAVMFIAGFGTFPVAQVVADSIKASRPVPAIKSKYEIVPANIVLQNLPELGTTTQVYVEVRVGSENAEMEFERANPESFGMVKRFPITVVDNETATTFMQKIYAQIYKEAAEDGFDTISVANSTGSNLADPTTITKLQIEGRSQGLYIDRISFLDRYYAPSTIIKTFTPTITASVAGIGSYFQVDREFPQTESTSIPYSANYPGQKRPVPGAVYSLIQWKMTHERNDVTSPEAADQYGQSTQTYELYINDAETALRDQILDFLMTKTGASGVFFGKTDGITTTDVAGFKA